MHHGLASSRAISACAAALSRKSFSLARWSLSSMVGQEGVLSTRFLSTCSESKTLDCLWSELRVAAWRSYEISSCVVLDPIGEVSDVDGEGRRNRGVDGRVLLVWLVSEPESSGSSVISDDDIMKAWARMVGVGVTSAIAAKPTPAPHHWGLTD